MLARHTVGCQCVEDVSVDVNEPVHQSCIQEFTDKLGSTSSYGQRSHVTGQWMTR